MAIDNFNLIKTLLKFDKPEEFYFLQLIQRKKDFEEGQQRMGRNNNHRMIKSYYIYNLQQLEEYKEEIIKLCHLFNCRAGINLNRRNQKDVALKCLEMIAIALRKDEFTGISKIYNSACGKESSTDKLWLIDLDEVDLPNLQAIIGTLKEIQPLETNKIIASIPSRTGLHLITCRFDRQNFSKIHPKLEIHTNNPVNLFIP